MLGCTACVTRKILRLTTLHIRTSRASSRARVYLFHWLGIAKQRRVYSKPLATICALVVTRLFFAETTADTIIEVAPHSRPPRTALSKLDACFNSIISLSPLSITSPVPSHSLLPLLRPTAHPRERPTDRGDPIGKPCILDHEGFVQSLAFLSFFGPGGRLLQSLDFVPGSQRDVLGRGEPYGRVRG